MFNFVKRLVMNNDKKTLIEYQRVSVNGVKNINRGGCGVFANLFGKKLESMGYDVEYIILFRQESCVNEIMGNKIIKPTDVFSCSWTHIVLRVNGKYYVDGDGVFTTLKQVNSKDNRNRYPLIIDKQLLSKLINSRYINNWNNTFIRSTGIKKLKGNLKLIN